MSRVAKNTFYSIRFVFVRIKTFFFITIFTRIITLLDFFLLANLTKGMMNAIVFSVQMKSFDYSILVCILWICISRLILLMYNSVTNYASSLAMMKYNDEFSFEIHQKLSEYPVEILDNPEAISNVEQAIRDAHALLSCFNNAINVIFSIISAISIITLSFSVDAYIALLTIGICIPSFFVNKKIKDRNYEMEKCLNTSNRATNYFLRLFHIQLNNMEIKLYGLSDFFKQKYRREKKNINGIKKEFLKKSNIIYCMTSVANTVLSYIIRILIIYKIIIKHLTVGDYSLFSSYMEQLQNSVSSIFTAINEIIIDNKKIENFREYYSYCDSHINAGTSSLESFHSISYSFKFENVTFKYPGTDRLILNNVNFTFSNTESIAFAGLNGAGKTTIIKLLLRYYSPTSGAITVNGVNINEIEYDSYKKLFSVMFQDLTSYQISLAENIGISDTFNINISKVEQILDQVELSELKESMSNTVGKEIDDHGVILSRGQLQKVNLAKALYKDACFYILDEPSASIDAMSEKMVFDKMFDLVSKNRGLILVSHRLSHLTKISKIVYLSNGSVTEMGSHEELMNNHGEYRRVFEMQKNAYM